MNPTQNPSAVRSQKEIIHALICLMNAYPYHDITVKQIILEAQIARKTFYRNFRSKDDVLSAYIDNILHRYALTLKQEADGQLSNILDIIFSFCTQNKAFLLLLRDNHMMHILLEKWNTFIPMIHEQVVNADCILYQRFSEKQVSYIISYNVGAVWNIIMKWIEYDMQDPPDLIKDTLLKYLSGFE